MISMRSISFILMYIGALLAGFYLGRTLQSFSSETLMIGGGMLLGFIGVMQGGLVGLLLSVIGPLIMGVGFAWLLPGEPNVVAATAGMVALMIGTGLRIMFPYASEL